MPSGRKQASAFKQKYNHSVACGATGPVDCQIHLGGAAPYATSTTSGPHASVDSTVGSLGKQRGSALGRKLTSSGRKKALMGSSTARPSLHSPYLPRNPRPLEKGATSVRATSPPSRAAQAAHDLACPNYQSTTTYLPVL